MAVFSDFLVRSFLLTFIMVMLLVGWCDEVELVIVVVKLMVEVTVKTESVFYSGLGIASGTVVAVVVIVAIMSWCRRQ